MRVACDSVATLNVKTSGVYAILNRLAGTAYIGSSVDIRNRIRRHVSALDAGRHHCVYLQRAWKKHGPAEFIMLVLDVERDLKWLRWREQQWMDIVPLQYNTSELATGPSYRHDPASTARRAASNRGRYRSEETKRLIGLGNKGKVRSPEVRARIAESLLGRSASREHRAAISAGLLKHYKKPGSRRRVSERSKATWASEDIRERRVSGIRRWASSIEGRQHLHAASLKRWSLRDG